MAQSSTSYSPDVADRITAKCDELVQRCLTQAKFDFRIFCEVWKKMDMSSIFVGKSGAEALEFAQEVVQIGKKYMLKETLNFRETEIGIFMVYAFLSLQPDEGLAHLRILPEDKPIIDRIKAEVKRKKRTGVRYALKSILTKGPVMYEATEQGMELQHRVTPIPVESIHVQPTAFFSTIFSVDSPKLTLTKDPVIDTKNNANDTEAKEDGLHSSTTDETHIDTNFNVVGENFASALEASFMTLSVSNDDFVVHSYPASVSNESGKEQSVPTGKTSAPSKTQKKCKGKIITKTRENSGKTKKLIEHAPSKRKHHVCCCRKAHIGQVVDPKDNLPSTSGVNLGIYEKALLQALSMDTKKNYKHLFKLPVTDLIKKPDLAREPKDIESPKVETGSLEEIKYSHTQNCKSYKRKNPSAEVNDLMPDVGTVSSTTDESHLILKKPKLAKTTEIVSSTVVNETVNEELMDTN